VRARRADQLVDVERNAAELDRKRLVVDQRVLAPAADADRADAEPERALEAAQPLLMNVSGRNGIGVERPDAFRRRARKHDVLVRRRRRMAAEDATGRDGRLEATEEREPILAELLPRPCSGRQEAVDVLGLLRAEVEREQELVGVPEDARALELLQQLDALARLRTALRDVAERDDQIRFAPLQIRERGAECDGVPVHVREESGSHTGTL